MATTKKGRKVALLLLVAIALHFAFCTGGLEVTSSRKDVPRGIVFTTSCADIDASDTWLWKGVYVRPGRGLRTAWILGWISPLSLILFATLLVGFRTSIARRFPITFGACCMFPAAVFCFSLSPSPYCPPFLLLELLILLPLLPIMLLWDAAHYWLTPFLDLLTILVAVLCVEWLVRVPPYRMVR